MRARGAEVTPVRVYQYGLPEDVEPLREAARRLAGGEFDVALFTTATQIEHLAQVAREQGIEDAALTALRKCRIGSIGPDDNGSPRRIRHPSRFRAVPSENGPAGARRPRCARVI